MIENIKQLGVNIERIVVENGINWFGVEITPTQVFKIYHIHHDANDKRQVNEEKGQRDYQMQTGLGWKYNVSWKMSGLW